jgi:multiple sugar transport system substrate-binding protein
MKREDDMSMLHWIKGAALAATVGAGLAASGARAADMTFMSFTFAEEANKASVQKLIDDFQAQSKVSVEPQGYAWGDMQKNILLRSRSNTAPDVAQLSERWLPNFASLPKVVDFNEVYGKEQLAALLDPAALRMGQVNGKQIGIPLMTGSIGMIANKEVLEKAGVSTMPTTVAEFKAALLAVRDKVPNSVPYAMATKNNNSIILDYMIWVWAHGGQIIAEDGTVKVGSPAGKAALAFMADMMKERLAAPEIDRPDSRRLFGQGVTAFYFDAPQARGFLRNFSGKGEAFDPAIAPVKTPVLKAGDTPRSIEWGHVLIAFSPDGKLSKDAPAAKWMSFIMSDAAQTTFTLGQSALPVTQAARKSAAANKDAFLTAWGEATGVPLRNEIGIWTNAAELTTIVGEEVQGALLGQKTADAAVDAMQKRLETAMANLKKGG